MTKARTSKAYPPPRLLVPKKEAIRRIKGQIERGHDLKQQRIFSMMDFEKAREKRAEWLQENTRILGRVINNPSFAEEYRTGVSLDLDAGMTLGATGQQFTQDINEQLRTLESFLERLKLMPELQAEEVEERQLQEKPIVQEPPRDPVREEKPREGPVKERPVQEEVSKEVSQKRELPKQAVPPVMIEEEVREDQIKAVKSREEPSKERQPKEELTEEGPQRAETLKRAVPPFSEDIREDQIQKVKSQQEPPEERLKEDEFPKEVPPGAEVPRKGPSRPVVLDQSHLSGGRILLVCGRDEALKESLLRFIEKLGLRASTLHEQPGAGIIEQFRDFHDFPFAIILLAPEDTALPRDEPKKGEDRISQKVIFEFGYCLGRLGRKKVCALLEEGLEKPIDYPGAVYIPLDSRGIWQLLLAKEIKQAGVEVDLNKAI